MEMYEAVFEDGYTYWSYVMPREEFIREIEEKHGKILTLYQWFYAHTPKARKIQVIPMPY